MRVCDDEVGGDNGGDDEGDDEEDDEGEDEEDDEGDDDAGDDGESVILGASEVNFNKPIPLTSSLKLTKFPEFVSTIYSAALEWGCHPSAPSLGAPGGRN